MKRFLIALLLIPTLITPIAGQSASSQTPSQSPSQTDVVMKAMTDELQRSVTELQFKDLEKPYFIQYSVTDLETYTAQATFGALTASDKNRQRTVQAQIRVGDYTFDNSEFVGAGQAGGAASTGVALSSVVENDYNGIRHGLWLATDAAYKQSVEQIARKRAFIQNKVRDEEIPDFSKEAPLTAVGARKKLEFDQSQLEKLVRVWSGVFKEFPEIQQSNVVLQLRLTHRYLVNSEGTRTLQPSFVVGIEADAGVQAEDGLPISHSIPVYVLSLDQLPSQEAFSETIRQMAGDLTRLRTAAVLEKDYSGPVLLSGPASAEMFGRVLAPDLSGQRPPLFERDPGNARPSELVNRLNRPVLPKFMSVFDDPTQVRAGNNDLIGHYSMDDQGVPSRRVSLVEDGLLKELLMSRRPAKDVLQSNGHGRGGGTRESAQIGNLFIEATDGKTYDELKEALISLCRDEKLEYGIVIKSLNPDGRGPLGAPILTYKVYVSDGHEELIRGASLDGISVRSLREIEAAGSDMAVSNKLSGNPGSPTPVSIIAPSVLIQEMELKRPTGSQQKPALLTNPYFKP